MRRLFAASEESVRRKLRPGEHIVGVIDALSPIVVTHHLADGDPPRLWAEYLIEQPTNRRVLAASIAANAAYLPALAVRERKPRRHLLWRRRRHDGRLCSRRERRDLARGKNERQHTA